MSTSSTCLFESVVGTLEVLYLAFSAILLLRGVWSTQEITEAFPPLTQMGKRTVQSLSSFDDDGAHPVPYLQVHYSCIMWE